MNDVLLLYLVLYVRYSVCAVLFHILAAKKYLQIYQ